MAKILFLSKRFKILLNYVIGPALFVWLYWSIYHQVQQQTDLSQSWTIIRSAFTGAQSWKLLLVVLLMVLHWIIEIYKWQLLIRPIEKVSFKKGIRAVLSGQALAFTTPNRVGESFGRAAFLEEGNRLRGIALSMVGGLSALLVIFLLGLPALLHLQLGILGTTSRTIGVSVFWYNSFVFVTTVGLGILLLIYFRLSWVIGWLERIPFVGRHRYLVQELENFHWRELTRILLLSICRNVIYVVQYVLLLQVFEVQTSVIDASSMVSVMFLVMAIIPTITLAELGFRGKIGLQLFGLLSTNSIGILTALIGIWIVNLIIPAIAGSLFILGLRLFRK